jgi:hypothetical protein
MRQHPTSKPSGGNDDTDSFDPQLTTIFNLLESRLGGIEKAVDPISFVTYQMYAIVLDLIDECVEGTPDVWDFAKEVTIVGDIMINRYIGGNFFQPLSFEVRF